MAVKIRLKRFGRKKRPFYRIVIADESCARDGKYIESVGHYNPLEENEVKINAEKVLEWIKKGAVMTPTCKTLIKKAGVKIG